MKSEWNKFRAFLVACVLAGGATALIGVVAAFLVGIYLTTFVGTGETIYLNFRGDGEPYLTHYVLSQRFATNTDLDGKPITLDDQTEFTREVSLPAGLPFAPRGERQPWDSRIIGFMDNRKPPVFWYLMHDGWRDGQAYFVGYSAANRERVGYIGTAGFREYPIPPAERFAVPGGRNWQVSQVGAREGTYNHARAPQGISSSNGRDAFQDWVIFLNGQSNVYQVDLATQSVRTVLDDAADPVISVSIAWRGGNTIQKDYLVMRTAEKIHLLNPHGETKTIPLAPQLRGRDLQMAERPDGGFSVAAVEREDHERMRQYLDVYAMAADGTLSEPRETWQSLFDWSDESIYQVALATGSPALLSGALGVWRTRQLLRQGEADSFGQALRMAFSEYALYLLATILAGAALAVACYRRQALYQLPWRERIVWPLFVFLMGLPGWIGYRYCRRWPVIEPCPSCHEPTPRDDEACSICGRQFPQPKLKGTEIFA